MSLLVHIGVAILTFGVTNIDDLLILSVYFANPRYKTKYVIAGQFLGMTVLVAVSWIGVLLGALLNDRYVSLLGVLPILLGLKDLIAIARGSDDDDSFKEKSTLQYVSVALVTIANGGDNIGVYTPLFATLEPTIVAVYSAIFLIMTAVLCYAGYWVVSHPGVEKVFVRHGKIILPVFLILLGVFILKDFFFTS